MCTLYIGVFLQRCMYFDFCDEGKMCLIDYYKEGKMCTLYIGVFYDFCKERWMYILDSLLQRRKMYVFIAL
jgi:hypothetical protein